MARRNVDIVFTANIKLFEKNLKKLERGMTRTVNKLARSADRIGRNFERAGRRMTAALTVPILAIGVASGRSAAMFDDSLTKINSLVGVSLKQIAAWRESILEIGPAVGKGPAELADAMFFITSAGLRGKEALDTLVASAKAAAAGLGETAAVADAATSAVNAYGSANLKSADAVGILVATVREGKAAADSIAGALGQVIPIASELDVKFHEVGATIATLTRLGLDASTAGTQLRGILSKILKPAQGAAEELKNVGLSVKGLREQLREKGLLATLTSLKKAFEGNEEGFARVFEDVQALTGVLGLVGKNAAETEKIFASLAKAGVDDLAKAFEAAQKSPMFKFRQAQAAINVVMIRFGTEILPRIVPVMEKMIAAVRNLARKFSALSEASKDSILKMLAITAIAGPILLVLGALFTSVAALARGFVALAVFGGKSFRLLGVAIARSVAAIVGTFATLIIAFGAIPVAIGVSLVAAAGAFVLFKETITEVVKAIVETARRWLVENFRNNVVIPFQKAINALVDLLPEKVKRALGFKPFIISAELDLDPGGAFAEGFARAREIANTELREISAAFGRFGAGLKAKLKSLLPQGIGEFIFGPAGADGLAEEADGLFERLAASLGKFSADAGNKFDDLSERMKKAAEEMQTAISASVSQAIVDFKSLGSTIKSVASIIKNNLIKALIGDPLGKAIGASIGGIFGGSAGGGRVQPGVPGLVGERGEERLLGRGIFIPSVPSTIVSNADSRRMGGGGQPITVNMVFNPGMSNVEQAVVRNAINATMIEGIVRSQLATQGVRM